MSGTTPPTHLTDAQLLEADGIVELFEIQLVGGSVLRLKANNAVTYLGNTYESFAIQLTGDFQATDTEVSRPKLSIVNPQGAFSQTIDQGLLDKATVIRRRVLYADLISNTSVYQENSWTLSQITGLNKQAASFELRGIGDMQAFIIPARIFAPPQFPQVSLV